MIKLWVLVLTLACAMFAGSLTGCSPSQAKAAGAAIEKAKVPAFNGTVAAFMLLDDCNARYADSIAEPTREQYNAAKKRADALEVTRVTLSEIREWLSGQNKDLDARAKLKAVIESLDEVWKSLKEAGVPEPKGLGDALSMARVAL